MITKKLTNGLSQFDAVNALDMVSPLEHALVAMGFRTAMANDDEATYERTPLHFGKKCDLYTAFELEDEDDDRN